ncbi:hypothetical protein D3C79_752600 [compost metagenome]
MLTILSLHFFFPGLIFFVISKSRKTFGPPLPSFPVNAHRHTRCPPRGHAVAAAAAAALEWTDNVDTRLVIYTKVVNRPFGVVDGINGATASGLSSGL